MIVIVLGFGLLVGEVGGARPSSSQQEPVHLAISRRGNLVREEQQGPAKHGFHRRPRIARGSATAALIEQASEVARGSTLHGHVEQMLASKAEDQGYYTRFCHATFAVRTLEFRNRSCPPACPYLAPLEEGHGLLSCHFKCVMATECGSGTLDRLADVADVDEMVCRRCYTRGCAKCDVEHTDRCLTCDLGYTLKDGHCESQGQGILNAVVLIVGLILLFLTVWCMDLGCCRQPCNQEGFLHGVAFREKTKLKKVEEEDPSICRNHRLSTNFLSTSNCTVAGRGMVLYFNFMLFSTIWPAVVALAWWLVGSRIGDDFLYLGTESDVTHAELCGAIYWGKDMHLAFQEQTVDFLLWFYVLNFAACIAFAAYQQWCYQRMQDEATLSNFVAKVAGLSHRSGWSEAEVDVKRFLENACGEEIVGVSLAWNIYEQQDDVDEIIEAELRKLMEADPRRTVTCTDLPDPAKVADYTANFGCFRRFLAAIESALLQTYVGTADEDKWEEDEEILEFIRDLRTTDTAFAVFRTEASRDAAIAKCKESGGFEEPRVKSEKKVHLVHTTYSPQTVRWKNFIDKPQKRRFEKMAKSSIAILLVQVLWGVCFYAPYVYYIAAFAYAHGDKPSKWSEFFFSMVVVAGNQMNYFICGMGAEYNAFTFADYQEGWYTIAYTVANFLNVGVDMVTTGWLSFKMMAGVGITLPDGRKFESLKGLHDIIEAFPMQKTLGAQLWLYNYPATFAIPYLLEPFLTVWIPYQIMKFLVRACPLILGRRAEVAMDIFIPMDMGRYADVVVNVTLCTVALFFAQGFYLKTFVACSVFHAWIYAFDHYRVLRCVPEFELATDHVDRFGQACMALPSGLILVAMVFKSNCMGGILDPGPACQRGMAMWTRCWIALFGHMVLHIFVVVKVVPWMMSKRTLRSEKTYEEVARMEPRTHFTTNPVHCLRSKYVYKHSPPFTYGYSGKTHLMKANPDIGCFFQEDMEKEEEEAAEEQEKQQASSWLWQRTSQAPEAEGPPEEQEEAAAGMSDHGDPSAIPAPEEEQATPETNVPAEERKEVAAEMGDQVDASAKSAGEEEPKPPTFKGGS